MTADSISDPRRDELERWLLTLPGPALTRMVPASADASFRRYFRLERGGSSAIAMDAPPEREHPGTWLRVARLMAGTGVHVPEVLAADPERGFVLMSDLGSRDYLAALAAGEDPGPLYAAAIGAIVSLQAAGANLLRELPPYDRSRLHAEMELFPQWFLGRHLGLVPDPAATRLVEAAFGLLGEEALAQPVVFVHRDYHSRNLMVCPGVKPGILDFQDAVRGPISYDLVSLLKDCYIVWPRARVLGWMDDYLALARQAGLDTGPDRQAFLRWFDRTGLQRHLKVLGIFARLWYRDGKRGYLADLPRVLDYVLEVTAADPQFADLDAWLRERVVPAFVLAQQRAGVAA
ncbi:MAG: aminoglycoside phosphotransferase [Gammaproteobacteria bacterium]|nr:MAG: aminoglycoside phosphotransferase [Gammaproteobacteria bacterium]